MGRTAYFKGTPTLVQGSVLEVSHFTGGSFPSFAYLSNSGLHRGAEHFQVFPVALGPSTVPFASVVQACGAAVASVFNLPRDFISRVYFGQVQVEQFSAKLSVCSPLACLPCLCHLTLLYT